MRSKEASGAPLDAPVIGADGIVDWGVRQAEAAEREAERLKLAVERLIAPRLTNSKEWADGAPPAREWLAGSAQAGWHPRGRVAMLTGSGAAGKSRLTLQYVAAVAGEGDAEDRRVLPALREVANGPVVAARGPDGAEKDVDRVAMIGWEDEPDEIWRRLRWLADADMKTASPENLAERFDYLNLEGAGPLWGPLEGGSGHTSTAGDWTETGEAALAWLRASGARLVIIDPLAAAFGLNENDRALVRSFLSALNRFAAELDAAVLLVAHPPKSGADYSGSTDWRNGVRSMWTLEAAPAPGFERPNAKKDGGGTTNLGMRLRLEKSNYGRAGIDAWLELADGDTDAGGGLAWKEVTAEDAVIAYAKSRGLKPTAREESSSGLLKGGAGRVHEVSSAKERDVDAAFGDRPPGAAGAEKRPWSPVVDDIDDAPEPTEEERAKWKELDRLNDLWDGVNKLIRYRGDLDREIAGLGREIEELGANPTSRLMLRHVDQDEAKRRLELLKEEAGDGWKDAVCDASIGGERVGGTWEGLAMRFIQQTIIRERRRDELCDRLDAAK